MESTCRAPALRRTFYRRTDRLVWRGPKIVSHAFVTIIADVPAGNVASLRASIEALGNPAIPRLARRARTDIAIHFASLNVFEASAGDRGHLVFEFSADGIVDELLGQLGDKLGAVSVRSSLTPKAAATRRCTSSGAGMSSSVGQTPFTNPGVNFTGTPGLSVERIRRERDLGLRLTDALDREEPPAGPVLERLEAIRKQLRHEPKWSWALEPEPSAHGGTLAIVPIPLSYRCPSLSGSQGRSRGISCGRLRFRPPSHS